MGKLKVIKNKICNFFSIENLTTWLIAALINIPIAKSFTFQLNKDNLVLYLAIIGASLAYASFFLSYLKKFDIGANNELKIKTLIDVLISSSFLLVFVVLFINSEINFGKLNYFIAIVSAILAMVAVFAFSVCIVKLWWFITKNIFMKK